VCEVRRAADPAPRRTYHSISDLNELRALRRWQSRERWGVHYSGTAVFTVRTIFRTGLTVTAVAALASWLTPLDVGEDGPAFRRTDEQLGGSLACNGATCLKRRMSFCEIGAGTQHQRVNGSARLDSNAMEARCAAATDWAIARYSILTSSSASSW
jgi:hypothetical protein